LLLLSWFKDCSRNKQKNLLSSLLSIITIMNSIENINLVEEQQQQRRCDEASMASSQDSSSHDATDEGETDGGGTHKAGGDSSTNKPAIGSEETKKINRLRIVLVLVLLATATAICTATYFFVGNEANDDYKLSVSSPKKVPGYISMCFLP